MYDARLATRTSGAAYTLSSTGVATNTVLYYEPARVWRLLAYVTTAVVSTVPTVVQFIYRPVFGSATNQVILGTVSIPGGAVVDTVYYKDITPYMIPAGSQVVYNTSTAATSSGAAIFDVLADFSPEAVKNETKFVLSS